MSHVENGTAKRNNLELTMRLIIEALALGIWPGEVQWGKPIGVVALWSLVILKLTSTQVWYSSYCYKIFGQIVTTRGRSVV